MICRRRNSQHDTHLLEEECKYSPLRRYANVIYPVKNKNVWFINFKSYWFRCWIEEGYSLMQTVRGLWRMYVLANFFFKLSQINKLLCFFVQLHHIVGLSSIQAVDGANLITRWTFIGYNVMNRFPNTQTEKWNVGGSSEGSLFPKYRFPQKWNKEQKK